MSANEMIKNIEALQEMEAFLEEVKNETEALRDSIKADMLAKGIDEMEVGQYIVRWTPVLTTRFDSTGFKKSHADLYKEFTKQTASRRFSISC